MRNRYLTKLAQDSVNMDVPLFTRILEITREGGVKSDDDLHWLVTRALKRSDGRRVLGMSDLNHIVDSSKKA